MSTPLLVAQNLHKRYGDVVAVDGVSLTLAPGEVLGLLGPNGAGKTTTIAMLSGGRAGAARDGRTGASLRGAGFAASPTAGRRASGDPYPSGRVRV